MLAFWNKLVGWDCVDGNNGVPVGCPNADADGLPNPVAGFPKSWDWPNGLALAAVVVPNPIWWLKYHKIVTQIEVLYYLPKEVLDVVGPKLGLFIFPNMLNDIPVS